MVPLNDQRNDFIERFGISIRLLLDLGQFLFHDGIGHNRQRFVNVLVNAFQMLVKLLDILLVPRHQIIQRVVLGLEHIALDLADEEHMTCFQSRFGREEWLRPYTDETLKSLPDQGIKSVQVVCPGFSADCLETIEEIGEENRDYFLEAGGERFEYIPCLNADPEHIAALADLVRDNLSGWTVAGAEPDTTAKLAAAAGAER